MVVDGQWFKLHFDSCPGCPAGVGTTMCSGLLQPGMLVDVEGEFVTVEGTTVFLPERFTLCPIQ
jgi:hypothetical protein